MKVKYIAHSDDPQFAQKMQAHRQEAAEAEKVAGEPVHPAVKAHADKVNREYAAGKRK